jgi:hypothetical protein
LSINAYTDIVVAYPLRAEDYARIVAAAARRGAGVFVATLSPPLAESLTNRGTRALSQAARESWKGTKKAMPTDASRISFLITRHSYRYRLARR